MLQGCEKQITTLNLDIDKTSSTSSTRVMVPHIEKTIPIKEIPNMPKNVSF